MPAGERGRRLGPGCKMAARGVGAAAWRGRHVVGSRARASFISDLYGSSGRTGAAEREAARVCAARPAGARSTFGFYGFLFCSALGFLQRCTGFPRRVWGTDRRGTAGLRRSPGWRGGACSGARAAAGGHGAASPADAAAPGRGGNAARCPRGTSGVSPRVFLFFARPSHFLLSSWERLSPLDVAAAGSLSGERRPRLGCRGAGLPGAGRGLRARRRKDGGAPQLPGRPARAPAPRLHHGPG